MDRREAIARQYRDWLVPGTLFTGIDASVVIYLLSLPGLTTLLIVAVLSAMISIAAFLFTISWSITRLEAIELLDFEPSRDKGTLYVSSVMGVLWFLASLILLTFERSVVVGTVSVVAFLMALALFVGVTMKSVSEERRRRGSRTK